MIKFPVWSAMPDHRTVLVTYQLNRLSANNINVIDYNLVPIETQIGTIYELQVTVSEEDELYWRLIS